MFTICTGGRHCVQLVSTYCPFENSNALLKMGLSKTRDSPQELCMVRIVMSRRVDCSCLFTEDAAPNERHSDSKYRLYLALSMSTCQIEIVFSERKSQFFTIFAEIKNIQKSQEAAASSNKLPFHDECVIVSSKPHNPHTHRHLHTPSPSHTITYKDHPSMRHDKSASCLLSSCILQYAQSNL